MSRRTTDERGAVTLMTALFLVVIVGISALAVDLGMMRVGKRDMQALSDLVALDMARQLDGNSAAVITARSSWASALQESIQRNADTLGTTPVVTVEVGTIDEATRMFTPMSNASSSIPTAVRVASRTNVNFAFKPGDGGVTAKAVAEATTSVCWQMGSWGLRLDAGNSTLMTTMLNQDMNQALGMNPPLTLSAASYTGLAGASITLGELATQLGIGTVYELASAQVTYRSYYLAVANALRNQGDVADAQVLETLASHVNASATLQISSIMKLTNAGNSALEADLNVLNLVAGPAFVANGTNLISIPNTVINVPGLSSVTASVKVIQKPSLGCGAAGDWLETSQIEVAVSGDLATSSVTNFVSTTTHVSLSAVIASARGTLTNVGCSSNPSLAGPEVVGLSVVSGLEDLHLTLTLGTHTAGSGWITGLLGAFGVKISTDASITVGSAVTTPPATNAVEFRLPPDRVGDVKSVGSTLALPTTGLSTSVGGAGLKTTLSVLGIPLIQSSMTQAELTSTVGGVSSSVTTNLLTPTINALNVNLLNDLSDLLGVRVGGADVWLDSDPDCSSPALRG